MYEQEVKARKVFSFIPHIFRYFLAKTLMRNEVWKNEQRTDKETKTKERENFLIMSKKKVYGSSSSSKSSVLPHSKYVQSENFFMSFLRFVKVRLHIYNYDE